MLEDEPWPTWGLQARKKGESPAGGHEGHRHRGFLPWLNSKAMLPDSTENESAYVPTAAYRTSTVLGTETAVDPTWPQPWVFMRTLL